jgi:hypothetical protein
VACPPTHSIENDAVLAREFDPISLSSKKAIFDNARHPRENNFVENQRMLGLLFFYPHALHAVW